MVQALLELDHKEEVKMTLKRAIELVKEVLGQSLDWDDDHYEAITIALDCMHLKQKEYGSLGSENANG